ncbi:MAG: prolipoprotein diacylglyceryl transferase [Verrucomicrobiota bacterium]
MDPVAFHLGPLPIYWYGVLAAAGFFAAYWTAGRRALLTGISREAILDLTPWLIIGAVIGARLLYVITHWETDFAEKPLLAIFNLRGGGLVYYGGLIGASLAVIFYARRKKLPLWKVADIIAPSIALGHAFGRIGCLMNGCCYGRACELPWAIHFPSMHETFGKGVHPTQIYEALLNFGLYLGLAWLYRRKQFDGQVFGVYMVAYALLRTFVESFRGDYRQYFLGFATPGQVISAVIFVAGLALLWNLRPAKPASEAPRS